MKFGNYFPKIHDKNELTYHDQSRLLRLRSKDFGLNELKYRCWKVELPIGCCGKNDFPSHFIFALENSEKKFFDKLNQENINRSLTALTKLGE